MILILFHYYHFRDKTLRNILFLFHHSVFLDNAFLISFKSVTCLLFYISLQWRYNGRNSVPNRQPYDCFLNRLFRRRSNKNIKAPRHWPLCREFTGDRWIPRTNGQERGKCFHLMTSSCYRLLMPDMVAVVSSFQHADYNQYLIPSS